MANPQLIIVADDLTGAADTGAAFAEAGLTTAIPFDISTTPETDVLAVSTETREATEDESRERVRAAADHLINKSAPRHWYKKIDSCLRGHPGAEIETLSRVIRPARIIIAPALPAEGRTTVGGDVLVHGEPMHTTSLCEGSSSIADHVCRHTELTAERLPLATVRSPDELRRRVSDSNSPVLIADADSNDDLRRIACAATTMENVLLVGSAGLARQLIGSLSLEQVVSKPSPPFLRQGPVLVVAGSRHEATAQQIRSARQQGYAVEAITFGNSRLDEDQIAHHADRVRSNLQRGLTTIVTTVGTPLSPLSGQRIASDLASISCQQAIPAIVRGYVVTGGDVAAAVCRHLGAQMLQLRGEVQPAIPWSTIGGGPLDGLPVASKAGSFGDRDTLMLCARFLRSLDDDAATG